MVAAEAALSDLSYMRWLVSRIIEVRDWTYSKLKELDKVTPYQSKTNFILIKLPKDAEIVRERLKLSGIQVRTYGNEPLLKEFIRVSVGTEEDMGTFIQVLSRIVDEV